jgi:DNA-binding transcriptional MerR regulator
MIPNKSNFKFQELTPITGVKPYVLRFWETEFEDIRPVLSDSGQKLYDRKDVEAILKIKKLLFEEKMSIPEAKKSLQTQEISLEATAPTSEKVRVLGHPVDEDLHSSLKATLSFIQEIKAKRGW